MTTISLPTRAAATSVRATGNRAAERQAELAATGARGDAASRSAAIASAGERTRTSKGFRPTGPKPVAFANSATPARLQSRAGGNQTAMTDEQDRERESRQTDENKFVELADQVVDEQRENAARLANDPIVNEN